MYLWGRARGAAGGEDEGRLSEVPRGCLPASWTCSGRMAWGIQPRELQEGEDVRCACEGVRVGPGPVGAALSTCSSSTRF